MATSEYIDYWRRRRDAQQAKDQRLARGARADVQQIVDTLVREFGATHIIPILSSES